MEYYIEYIFAENFFIDFILLYITGKLIKKKIIYKRLLLASFLGAMYVIAVAYMKREYLTYFIVKFSISLLMLIISYDTKGFINNIRLILCFYIVTVIMVGIITALYYVTEDRIDVNLIIVSFFVGYVTLKFFFNEVRIKRKMNNYMRNVTIRLNDKCKSLKAFIDTGNELTEPLMGKPVIVVNIDSIKDILGEDEVKNIMEFYLNEGLNFENLVLKSEFNLRIVKYNTISSRNSSMVCVVPQNITILDNDENIINADAVVGICPRKISKKYDYEALLFKKLLDWESEKKNDNDCKFC